MMRDLISAWLMLALAGAPFGTAAATAGLIPLCSLNGVRWVDLEGNPAPAPAGPDAAGCAHLLCPGRERRAG